MSCAVAGAPQPGRDSGGAGAAGQAGELESPALGALLPCGPPDEQAAARSATTASNARPVRPRACVVGRMAQAYPWIVQSGAAWGIRIRRHHTEGQ
jgi:hypothetical protein